MIEQSGSTYINGECNGYYWRVLADGRVSTHSSSRYAWLGVTEIKPLILQLTKEGIDIDGGVVELNADD